jgi:hypothetical protein
MATGPAAEVSVTDKAPEERSHRGTAIMRRLISTLAAGLLAGGTVLTCGIASADTTAVHNQATCTNQGPYYFYVAKNGVKYFLGTPNTTFSGAAAILKPKENSTTRWTLCFSPTDIAVFSNRGLALTSRSASTNVTLTPAGNGGDGFASQQWLPLGGSQTTSTFKNLKTGQFLRVRNSGPIMRQTVTTGATATLWTLIFQ